MNDDAKIKSSKHLHQFYFSTAAQLKNRRVFDDWKNHLRNGTDEFSTEYTVMYDNWQRGKIRKEFITVKL